MSNFEEVELLLSKLLVASEEALSSSERAEIQRFIDVGEYGLALETAVDIYDEEAKSAPAEVVALVGRLAKAMAMDCVPLLKRLSGSS